MKMHREQGDKAAAPARGPVESPGHESPTSLAVLTALDARVSMPTYGRFPVAFVRGEGMRLYDDTGKEYLDFLSGLGVTNLGHCHPALAAATAAQMTTLVHVSNLFYTAPQLALAQRIGEIAFPGKVFLANSGAEANECAIKLARRWGKTTKGEDCYKIVTAERSFHGRTMKTLAATGQPDKQAPFAPMPPGFVHVPLNDMGALEAAVDESTAAVMLEVIQGEGGVYPCTADYLAAVRRLCDEREMLLILDEVQTGCGRTGRMFAYQHSGIVPDVLTAAKGLANGLPIGACLARAEVADVFRPGDHGSTFGGGPVVCAAALATLDAMAEEGLVERAAEMGEYLAARLGEVAETSGAISEIRGRGLMLAIELAAPDAREVVLDALGEGLVAGAIGANIVRFLPPLIVDRPEIDRLVAFLADRLGQA
jgi:acetylornithine/N-succinyldiaminopimelate aminotransferase